MIDKERDPFWYMRNVTIWCYSCGMLWLNKTAEELYGKYSKCTICGGYTDGIQGD